ncbi:glycosyltransferase [Candidatus Sumerlaeota bacterium]|nr:glycosyltransferase [Candidatus Sumerlaeota bacterium]
MTSIPYISIVILTAKRQTQLRNCLQSLISQNFRNFEVIIVDNSPSPETRAIIRDFSLDIRLIDNDGASSYAEARNKGVHAARGEFIAFIDDDCISDPAWLFHLSEIAPNIDAAGGVVLPLKKLPFPSWWKETFNWLVGLSVPGLLDSRSKGQHYPQTANMMIRREILLEEGFQEMGGEFSQKRSRRYAGREDAELWRRLRLNGRRCAVLPKAVAYHDIPLERLRFSYLMRRAFNDGLAYWRRERKTDYAEWAVKDIVFCAFRILKAILPGKRKNNSPVENLIWMSRQTGFMMGFIFYNKLSLKRFGGTALWLLIGIFCYMNSVFKGFVRKRLAGTYHKRRRYEIPQSPPGNLLIAACGFLGDMILLAPILQDLRASLPKTKITILGYGNADVLFRESGLVDELIACPSEGAVPEKERKKFLKKSLEKRNFDVVIVPYYHNAPVRPLFYKTKAPVITFDSDVGFPRRTWYDLAKKRVKKDFSIHEIQNLYRLVSELNMRFKPEPYRLPISSDAQSRVDDMLRNLSPESDRLILLHAGAGKSWKAWPLEHWDALAKRIHQRFGIKPAFIGDEIVGKMIENLASLRDSCAFNLCFAGDIAGLAALIKRGDILITNDSGPKHLAMAIGTPTITLYGAMDERRWGALWEAHLHAALRAVPADLSPEELLGLPPDYSMARITPEMIMELLEKFWNNMEQKTCPTR